MEISMQAEVAKMLLQINAIKIEPSTPFTWASGWKSPIYCDNRKILSFPRVRDAIRDLFTKQVVKRYPSAEVIAGVATGAIAHGVLVADALNLPFVYVRPAPKSHGLENLVEGVLKPGQRVVVIEDLVSTGSSSLKAARAIVDAGADVLGMVAIFTYEFPQAEENFREAGITLTTLSRYRNLIEECLRQGLISGEDQDRLLQWRSDPANWGT